MFATIENSFANAVDNERINAFGDLLFVEMGKPDFNIENLGKVEDKARHTLDMQRRRMDKAKADTEKYLCEYIVGNRIKNAKARYWGDVDAERAYNNAKHIIKMVFPTRQVDSKDEAFSRLRIVGNYELTQEFVGYLVPVYDGFKLIVLDFNFVRLESYKSAMEEFREVAFESKAVEFMKPGSDFVRREEKDVPIVEIEWCALNVATYGGAPIIFSAGINDGAFERNVSIESIFFDV